MSAPAPTPDPQRAREAADAVLAGPDFSGLRRHWWDPILGFLSDPIGYLTNGLEYVLGYIGAGAGSGPVAWLIAVMVTAAVVFAVVRLTRGTRVDRFSAPTFAPAVGDKSPADLDREADAYADRGQWDQVVRLRYAACVAALGTAGLLRVRPGRTTGEYHAEVGTNVPAAQGSFDRLTRLFERVWYGGGTATSVEGNDATQLRQSVLREAKS